MKVLDSLQLLKLIILLLMGLYGVLLTQSSCLMLRVVGIWELRLPLSLERGPSEMFGNIKTTLHQFLGEGAGSRIE